MTESDKITPLITPIRDKENQNKFQPLMEKESLNNKPEIGNAINKNKTKIDYTINYEGSLICLQEIGFWFVIANSMAVFLWKQF